jgi:uncharacterized repeat protein (TIGR03806 family)
MSVKFGAGWRFFYPRFTAIFWLLAGFALVPHAMAAQNETDYGLNPFPAFKNPSALPHLGTGALPALLSKTGLFKDLSNLVPTDGLVPYDLIVPFWSDGATKRRWVVPPDGGIKFSPTGEWSFPEGTIFVKTFELPIDETQPLVKRRLETRLLVRDAAGGVYGAVYKWRPDNQDADLLTTNLSETISIRTPAGLRHQTWYYPSREDCLTCHTANAGYVLGVKTRQLNRSYTYPSGLEENELRAWSRMGLFDTNLEVVDFKTFPKLAPPDDQNRTLEDRARSYLDANCAQCHRPSGTVAYFDARYDTPLAAQNLINGPVLIDERIENPRIISPNDIWRSILYMRASSVEAFKMPPLAHNEVDKKSMALLKEWIESLPGPAVLPPPTIRPAGGHYGKPVEVTLKSEPGATIRYTTDGTVPTASDMLYEKPIQLADPTVLRARAFKPRFTKSITAQEIFIIGG